MNGPQHIVVGVVAAVGWQLYVQPFVPAGITPLAVTAGCVIVGSLAPDIDHPNATIARKVHIGRGQGPFGFTGYIGGIFRAVLGGHRGFTHTGIALGLLSWTLWRYAPSAWWPYALGLIIGYASHLLADMTTEAGIPLFWPVIRR